MVVENGAIHATGSRTREVGNPERRIRAGVAAGAQGGAFLRFSVVGLDVAPHVDLNAGVAQWQSS